MTKAAALIKACYQGSIDKVRELLNQGVNVNAFDKEGNIAFVEQC